MSESPVHADVHPLLRFTPHSGGASALVIDPAERGRRISPKLFSHFFEHMAYATIGGVLAELLVNPTLHRRSFLTPLQVAELRRNAHLVQSYVESGESGVFGDGWVSSPLAGGWGVTLFDDFTREGVPLGWAPLGRAHAAVGNMGGAVRLPPDVQQAPSSARIDVDTAPNGIRQGVFLPSHAPAGFRAAASWRITKGAGELEFALRRRLNGPHGAAGEVLTSTRIAVSEGTGWRQAEAVLHPGDVALRRMEPVDFCVRWVPDSGAGDLYLDSISLMRVDHIEGFDPEVVEALREARIPEIRWPGGNFANFYRWREGVGPIDLRPTVENRAWGGLDHNRVGTDEFLRLCALIGSEPHITVNSGTGTADEAAAWVEYCNGPADTPMGRLRSANGHDAPYDVRVWEVGNENYGEWQGGNVGSEENARRFSEFATHMRSASPTPLYLLACGNWFDLVQEGRAFEHVHADGSWHSELLKQAAGDIDGISLHSLPVNDMLFGDASDREVNESLLAQVVSTERHLIPDLLATCDRATRPADMRPIQIAITEWGPLGTAPGRMMVENAGGALWGATFLNFAIRNGERVTMTSPNGLFHGGAVKKAAGVLYQDPQFEMVQQYRSLAGAVPLGCHLRAPAYDVRVVSDLGTHEQDVPYLDALAYELADSRVGLIVVNRNQEHSDELSIAIKSRRIAEPVQVLTRSYPDMGRTAHPARTSPVLVDETLIEPTEGELRLVLEPSSVTWMILAAAAQL